MTQREHPYYEKLKEQLAEGRLDRREFVRYSALLGVSATAAYAFAGDQKWLKTVSNAFFRS